LIGDLVTSDLFEVSKEIMLITGASQGLWRQFARGLSAQGAAVVLAARQTGQRVRVNALAPGYIDAEMNHEFWATPAGEKLTKRIPQRRVGAESDLDGAIMLLASGASRYMTGSVVTVDGGFLLN